MTQIEILQKYPEAPRINKDGMVRLIPGMQLIYMDGETIATVVSVSLTGSKVRSEKYGDAEHFLYENRSAIR